TLFSSSPLRQPPSSPLFPYTTLFRSRISLLGEGNAGLAGLAGDVLVAVQDHLSREGRMPADFDGEMTPFGVQDMKRIVVDVRGRLLSFDVVFGADIPNRRRRSTNQDQK